MSFIPKREIGTKSRSDPNSDGDTGTYKAEAELGSVAQIYADIPLTTSEFSSLREIRNTTRYN